MTKTTEELKREMYDGLARVSRMISDGCNPKMVFPIFEEMLENYLQALREDHDTLRNKLQAFEFANRSAAELLSEALREPSGLRKSVGSMVHQNQTEVVSQDDSEAVQRYPFSEEECLHSSIYKDIVAGPRHLRCAGCGARARL